MSIEALNWARKIHVGDSLAKSLLRAIADYADEHGHCFPSHRRLAADCEFSIATVKRRISQLEELGLLVTFRCWMDEHGQRNKDERGRETSREIRLSLGRQSEIPAAADDADDIETDAAGGAVSTPSQQRPVPPALPDSPTAPPPGAVVNHPNEPSSNLEDSPPTPSGGGVSDDQVKQESDPEHFPEFKRDYPSPGLWNWAKVVPVFRSLTAAEAEHARAAIPFYAAQVQPKAPRGPKPMRPDRWLRERLFSNFPDAKLPEQPPPMVFIAKDSDAHRAMRVLAIMLNKSAPEIRMIDGQGEGLFRRGDVPVDYAALGQFADLPITDWQLAEPNSKNFFAWSKRVHEWTGQRVEPQIVMLEGFTTIEFNGKKIEAQKRAHGLRIPWPWPPRKDGSLCKDSEGEQG
jgi:DNA-binding Lrp family transcriptional regulator